MTKPINESGYPSIVNRTPTTVDITSQTNENGCTFFVIVDRSATAPTSQQVKNGQDSTGTPVAFGLSGAAIQVANFEAYSAAINLAESTNYDAYVVSEDSVSNLQDNPTKVEFST